MGRVARREEAHGEATRQVRSPPGRAAKRRHVPDRQEPLDVTRVTSEADRVDDRAATIRSASSSRSSSRSCSGGSNSMGNAYIVPPMSTDVDRLVDMIVDRVKERLGSQPAAVKLNVLPRDRGECNDDS